jgi:hypothetical protein
MRRQWKIFVTTRGVKRERRSTLAGCIAAHFLQNHTELFRIKSEKERSGFWVQYLSDKEEGLCEPFTLWMALFRKIQDIFRIFHEDKSCIKLPGVFYVLTNERRSFCLALRKLV